MVVVTLRGRLGNNLFQYAVGRALAEKHGTRLFLDASKLPQDNWENSSALGRLPIRAKIIRSSLLARRIIRNFAKRIMNVVSEVDPNLYEDKILRAPNNTLVFGYFQKIQYFEQVLDRLRSEITTHAVPWPKSTSAFANEIKNCESVVIHVRRTDFLDSKKMNICTAGYYSAAITRMRQIFSSPRFFIFSDDPDWCRENFLDADQTIVSFPNYSSDPLHDLHLMSCARHHIISNSTYSWWAAWMGEKSGQRVICPNSLNGLICKNWDSMPV